MIETKDETTIRQRCYSQENIANRNEDTLQDNVSNVVVGG